MFCWLLAAMVAPAPKVSGWLVFWNPRSLETYETQALHLDDVAAEWITVNDEGMPVRRDGSGKEREKAKTIAKKHGNKLLALASNYAGEFDAKRVQTFLYDPDKRKAHIEAMRSIVVEDKLDGVDLDYESLDSKDRDLFSTFVEELGQALSSERKILAVTVHPKESEPGSWGGPAAQDYERIGKAADVVRVMGYDYSWTNSPSGPISPNAWVERVMKFAMTQVPAAKLELGIAGYGYDWSKKPTTSLTWPDWLTSPGEATTDPESGELVKGDIRFSGAGSNKRKLEIAKKLGLRGVALWYIGAEDPAFWSP